MSAELGFFADEVPEVRLRGQRISSSKIRRLLVEGKINPARKMLGRPYGRGRTNQTRRAARTRNRLSDGEPETQKSRHSAARSLCYGDFD
jgi:FAD synthase